MIERYSCSEMSQIWNEEAKYAAWAQVERAHLEVLVENKLAPKETLPSFDKALQKKSAADFLLKEQETGHDVIAFVAEIASAMGEEGRYLHFGLTSSDVVDTAQSLRLAKACTVLTASLSHVRANLASLAFHNADVICMGRTHGIHAEPMSFGQVLAGYFAEFQRAHLGLLQAAKNAAIGKLSGAVGTYSQLPPEIEQQVMAKLGLSPETLATQVIPRDRILRVGQAIENIANGIDRFATNLRHWARSELGEVLEPFSAKQKGSSAMPHKKNPILAENLCGLARTVRGYVAMLTQNVSLWHERDISHSSAERIALPDLFVNCHFMLERLRALLEGLQIQKEAMLANLEKLGGLWASQSVLTALVKKGVGRQEAYEIVQSLALPINAAALQRGVKANAFFHALQAHPIVAEKLSLPELESLFVHERFLKFVPYTFKQVFGMVPEEFFRLKTAAKGDSSAVLCKVPALEKVYHVRVELLPDVLDTEAKTIETDMVHHNIRLHGLRQAKTFIVRASNDLSMEQIQKYAQEVLHNAVIEQFSVEVVQ